VLLDGSIMYVPRTEATFLRLGQGNVLGIPNQVVLFVVIAVLVHLFLKYTRLGRLIYAHGDNPEAARITGIGVRPITVFTYTASAVIAAFAGMVSASSMASMDTAVVNTTLVFDVLLVVVLGGVSLLGGRGSIAGVVAATGLIGTLLNGLTIMNVDNTVQDIARSLVLLGAILLDIKLHPRDEETSRQGDI
jgi:ribose transport system permease protein